MYLVIETKTNNDEFTHFIELTKDKVERDIKCLIMHIKYYENEEVVKVYFSNAKITNW